MPANITYKGRIKQLVKFTDTTGTYLLIATQTAAQVQGRNNDNRNAHLYAYVFRWQNKGTANLLWQLNDGIDDCPLGVMADFITGTIRITDVDKNSVAEVWLMYRTACRGDVSGAETKIIMHQGNTKYAMRG